MFGLIKNNIKTKIGIVLPASYPASRVSHESVSVTADGVKTYQTLLNELFALVDFSKVTVRTTFEQKAGSDFNPAFLKRKIGTTIVEFYGFTYTDASNCYALDVTIKSTGSAFKSRVFSSSGMSTSDSSSAVATNGEKLTIYYD